MKPIIKDFNDFSPSELYELFKNIYSTSEGMSETLEDKYPSLNSFENDNLALQSQPGAVALVVEFANKPVAYLTIRPRRQTRLSHTADLNMGVADTARNLGIGKLILQAGIEQASSLSELEIVYLMVRSDNTPAISLYERFGFETIATLSRDTKIGTSYFDGLLMRKFVDK
jgi:ribosomal protein S18 acetylase RimI-like enzyme